MRRLWGRHSSSNVQKVLWALDELGLAFDHEIVGGPYGGLDRPDFAALTPVRRIPVLEDGGITVWESHAILRHLARTYGAVFARHDPEHIAGIDQWMDYSLASFQPPMIVVFWQLVRFPPQERSAEKLAGAFAELEQATEVLDARLGHSEWLAGDSFSIADIAAGTLLYRYYDLDFPRPERPALQRWYVALQERPAFRDRVMTSYDELRPG